LAAAVMICSCQTRSTSMNENKNVNANETLRERGIRQTAALWTPEDGTQEELEAFIEANYAATPEVRKQLFDRLEFLFEQSNYHSDELMVALQGPTVQTDCGEPTQVDWILSAYDPMGHFFDDMFENKIAFLTVLNFPHFTLAEKDSLGQFWSRLEWAYARMGDVFVARIPASVRQANMQALTDAENYIADYNIRMGYVIGEKAKGRDGERLWDENMSLLSHWNLRDELKSNYADVPNHVQKQELIYQIMLRIIRQEIPQKVINSTDYTWDPVTNLTYQNGQEVTLEREPDTRYQQILNIFHAIQLEDACRPDAPTYVQRHCEEYMEVPEEQLVAMLKDFISSDEVKQTAALIRERLGRDLRPYDIWYDGFKSRSTYPEDALSAKTRALYPTAKAYEKGIPAMLERLGFAPDKAAEIASHITVDPARGSGHARPCVGKGEPARLRTRIAPTGMDYKGYNIAVHEMGHNVEEVISLYNVDYYSLRGIPSDGFTEASAFMFQKKDLELLGYGRQQRDENDRLDHLWSTYEIMGVSLVDIEMWKWLYQHPKASAAELREAVIQIAADVWNQYYEPLLGEKDCPLLAIYSHMVGYAMYLPGYSIGHVVQKMVEDHMAEFTTPQAWAKEYERIYRLGRLTPNTWLQQAVGRSL